MREISVDINGVSYLVIYGKHINNWFISILNRNVCTEVGCPEDFAYNVEKLVHVLGNYDEADTLETAFLMSSRTCDPIRRI